MKQQIWTSVCLSADVGLEAAGVGSCCHSTPLKHGLGKLVWNVCPKRKVAGVYVITGLNKLMLMCSTIICLSYL